MKFHLFFPLRKKLPVPLSTTKSRRVSLAHEKSESEQLPDPPWQWEQVLIAGIWDFFPFPQMLQSGGMRSQSSQQQQQGCATVPREQFLQLHQQLLQAERRSQRLQEELESRPSGTNMQQVRLSPLSKWKIF